MDAPAQIQEPIPTQATGVDDVEAGIGSTDSINQDNEEPIFNDEKFDAGIDVNEEEDPKKYLEKLTGKLAQTLRTYSKDQGADYELEKYILNSIISATHTSQMPEEEQSKIVNKIETAGSPDEKDVQQEPTPQEGNGVETTPEGVQTEGFDLDKIVTEEIEKIPSKK